MVFECLPTDLAKVLLSPQYLTTEHVRWLALDLLKVLKYLESLGICHRDLKPANTLLSLKPVSIKVCDFGLARSIKSDEAAGSPSKKQAAASSAAALTEASPPAARMQMQRQLTEHVVTRWYRAPEIIWRDKNYSAAVDMWSAGCILAELLSMQKESVPEYPERKPLFPGASSNMSPRHFERQDSVSRDTQDQLSVIISVMGTPSAEDIEGIGDDDIRDYLASLPAKAPVDLKQLYPGADSAALSLLKSMLHLNPSKRISVEDALAHDFFSSIRELEEEVLHSVVFFGT